MHTLTVQDVTVPSLGFGTWQLTDRDCVEGVEHAIGLGYRHIDTAQNYGNEEQVGQGIANAGVDRDELFLTTKLGGSNLTTDRVRSSTQESLRKLGTDYVDLLLIHWPSDDVALSETLDAMRALREDGLIKAYGVSNFPPSLVKEAVNHSPILANQVEYHPFLNQDELIGLATEYDHMLTAYSPLAQGDVTDDPVLDEIAEAHDATPAQVSLRWLIQQPNVAAIPKASTAKHRESNLAALELELSDDEMRRIFGLARGERLIDPSSADWER